MAPGLLPVALAAGRLVPAKLLRLLRTADCLRTVVIRLLPIAAVGSAAEAERPAIWNVALGTSVGIRTTVGYAVATASIPAVLAATVVSPAATILAAIALTATVAVVTAIAALTATTIAVMAP